MARLLQREVIATRITRGPLSGGWRCTAPTHTYVAQDFLYYTKREAVRLFQQYVNSQGVN